MQGTITITINSTEVIAFEMKVQGMDNADKLILLDGLVRALSCTQAERRIYGLAIAAGGIGAISGEEPAFVSMPLSVVEKARKNKDKRKGDKP